MNHFEKIAVQLESYGLDAILLTGEANRFYATGFHSMGTDGAALITRKKNYYFTDARYTEAAGRCIQNAQLRETGHGHGYADLLAEVVSSDHIGRMGFEDACMTVQEHARYQKALSCELVPATELLWKLRAQKDLEELEALTAAQRIAERALEDILNDIRPGITEKEIAARIQYRMLHYGAEDKSFDPIVVSGPNGSLPHGVPSEKLIQAGEFVTMDFGCVYHGYCSDMTRTFFCKTADPKYAAIHDLVRSANEIAEGMIRPGIPLRELDIAAREHIASAGYGEYFTHRLGHFIGQTEHEKGDVSAVTELVAKPGMIFSIEPGVYLPGQFGVRVEDLVLVTEEGCEILNRVDKHWKTVG